MAIAVTEQRHQEAEGLDTLAPASVLRLLLSGQRDAAKSVEAALDAIAAASELMADALSRGGRLVYAGAGSSGLMALADALELPGTYGVPHHQVVLLLAGGAASLSDLAGGYEDDVALAREDAAKAGLTAADVVIALSASGSTPYALAVIEAAKEAGARVVAIANNRNARLFERADVAVLLETPPEVVSGSTRMGAGTAQKITLNMLSTLACIRLGHVHDCHMVNLKADNGKLRQRAARMVSDISGVGLVEAAEFLDRASGSVKVAVLLASGATDIDAAEAALAGAGQNLRRALAAIRN